jgi:hypothetical protein
MTRNQTRAILQGARMALPCLGGRLHAEAWDAFENLYAALDRREPRICDIASAYVELIELHGDVRRAMEGETLPVAVPLRAILAERATVSALRAVAEDSWDHAVESDAFLRRLAPDLMFDLTVDVGLPPARTAFAGRWLVEPHPAVTLRDDGVESYCGVAQTRPDGVAVYRAYLDPHVPGRLDRYGDLAAVAAVLPADIVRRAATTVVREFNRQAWLRAFNEDRERIRQQWLHRDRAPSP